MTITSSDHHVARPLELVLLDVWIAPISSISWCKFYDRFIDDFSRFFPNFWNLKWISKFFSLQIKQYQSDNSGEFLSNQIKNLFTKCEIYYRLMCPYISQQKGMVERKHRHIQEIELKLLDDYGLSQKTALMPSKQLLDKVLAWHTIL